MGCLSAILVIIRNACAPTIYGQGAPWENSQDRNRKGRSQGGVTSVSAARGQWLGSKTHPEAIERGQDNGMSVLNEDAVREIRRAYANGEATMPELARRYGVTRPTIGYAINRYTWKHVT